MGFFQIDNFFWLTYLSSVGDSANCCSGSHNTAATCPSSGEYYPPPHIWDWKRGQRMGVSRRCFLQLFQEQLSKCLCLRVWRVEWHCSVDLWLGSRCWLYRYVLPLNHSEQWNTVWPFIASLSSQKIHQNNFESTLMISIFVMWFHCKFAAKLVLSSVTR